MVLVLQPLFGGPTMKSLLITALVMTTISFAEARSILVFKTVNTCQSIKKHETVLVLVQEAQDGQAQLVISNPLSSDAALKVQVKKSTPPPMMAGGSVSYSGKTDVTKEVVSLKFNGVRPIKVGRVTGRSATLSREKLDDVALICSAAK